MTESRSSSQPDRSAKRRHRNAKAGGTSSRSAAAATALDPKYLASDNDPGQLIEAEFFAQSMQFEPDELILIWLALLPRGASLPDAARELRKVLMGKLVLSPTPVQQRLLELLTFVSRHRPKEAAGQRPALVGSQPHRLQ